MKYLLLIPLMMFLTSCTLLESRSQKQEETYIHNDAKIAGSVAGVPVDLTIAHEGTTSIKSEEKKETSSPATSSLISSIIALITTGGFGLAIRQMLAYKATLSSTVDGIDEFKSNNSEQAGELLAVLSKKMDSKHKKLIRNLHK